MLRRPGVKSRQGFAALGCIFLACLAAAAAQPEASRTEEASFASSPGDSLYILCDYGRVQLHAWDQPKVDVRARISAQGDGRASNVEVVSEKRGRRIDVRAYFYQFKSESVQIDIQAPAYMDVNIWGLDPEVDVSGILGRARIQAGKISASDLGRAVLIAENGPLVYKASEQPGSDIYLESAGDILCSLPASASFKAWLKAAGEVRWNDELCAYGGAFGREVGEGRALLHAFSSRGNIRIRVEAGSAPPPDAQSSVRRPLFRSLIAERDLGSALAISWAFSHPLGKYPALLAASPPWRDYRPERRVDAAKPETPGNTKSAAQQDARRAQREARERSDGYRVGVRVDWVHLNVSVVETKTNRAVADLTARDFEVYEDGVRQTVERFSEAASPFHVLLLLDTSWSTSPYIDFLKNASARFLESLGADDKVAVAEFDSEMNVVSWFSEDRAAAIKKIKRLSPGTGTAFYKALRECAVERLEQIKGRKAIVVFTDGADNSIELSGSEAVSPQFDRLLRDIEEIDSLVYAIYLTPSLAVTGGSIRHVEDLLAGLRRTDEEPTYESQFLTPPVFDREIRRELRLIAEQTGGRLYEPSGLGHLESAYAEVVADLRAQYSLGYLSTNPPKQGEWREIKVRTPSRHGLAVRTRRGYYLPR